MADGSIVTGASMNRGASFQSYQTPEEFLTAVINRFGPLGVDLAASDENYKAVHWYTEQNDSLTEAWAAHWPNTNCWLNPPFGNLAPWAAKCAAEMKLGARILFLTPASVGANWFQQHVVPNAHVIELSPRLSFDGQNSFPKDLILSVFYGGLTGRSHWRWK